MPRHRHRRRTMKGGFWDTLSGWGSSISSSATGLWQKTKDATSSATSGLTGSTATPTSYTFTPAHTTSVQPMVTGGRTKRRRMKGGFKDNTPTTGLAAHAASFSGPTAQPHNWVGGRTRRRRGGKHRHSKSCRHRR
jgi:hypothetical protein